jgi:hypothetical protein
MKSEGHVARIEKRNAYRILVGKSEGHVARIEKRNSYRILVGKSEGHVARIEKIQISVNIRRKETNGKTKM